MQKVTPAITHAKFTEILQKLNQTEDVSHQTKKKLTSLHKKTETAFKKSKDSEDLYQGVETAIKIISTQYDQDASAKILVAVAPIIIDKHLKTVALQEAITLFVARDNYEAALNACEQIPKENENDRMESIREIIERVIETDDFEEALRIMHEENLTDFPMEYELREKIVNKIIDLDDVDRMEIAVEAARGIFDDDRDHALEKIVNFLLGKGELKQAIEVFEYFDDKNKKIAHFTKFLNEKNDLESLISLINDLEEELQFDIMKELIFSLLNEQKADFAMAVVDDLIHREIDGEEVFDFLERICSHIINDDGAEEHILKIVNDMIGVEEIKREQIRRAVLRLIKLLESDRKNLASKVHKLLRSF